MRRIQGWFEGTRKADWVRLALFSCALGMGISLAMGLHYGQIRGSMGENYLTINLNTFLKGLLFAVPVFLVMAGLQAGCPRVRIFGAVGERKISERKFFFLVWGALIVSWLPYLLTFYPGGIVGDGAEALEYAIQTSSFDSRWGTLHILLLRLFLAIGRVFSSDVNVGIFLYVVCQYLVFAAACSAVITTLRRKGLSPVLLVVFTFAYAFFGHYASYAMCLWKDGLFAAGVTLLALLLWDMWGLSDRPHAPSAKGLSYQGCRPFSAENEHTGSFPGRDEPLETFGRSLLRDNWKISLILLFLCFWRNFVCYGVLVAGIILLFKKSRRALAILLIVIAVFSILVQGPLFRAIGLTGTGGTQEALAIPIQQVAAAISSGVSLTAEQEELLYSLLPKEEWVRLYTPALADSVKFAIDEKALQEKLGGFLRCWLALGVRAPGAYLKAWGMETLGFWQPYGSNKGFYYDWFVGVQDLYGRGYENKDLILQTTGATLEPSLMGRFEFIPSGTLVWIMLGSMVLVLCQRQRRGRRMLVLMPFLVVWGATMIGTPIAYSYRYVESLAVGLPIIVLLPFECGGDGEVNRVLRSLKVGKVAAGIAAAVVVVAFVVGIYRVGWFGGKLVIPTAGEEDRAKYYVTSGLSVNEGEFAWTDGEEMEVRVPTNREEGNVAIHVVGTFEGEQRYSVKDSGGEIVATGSLAGAGEIRFPVKSDGKEIGFTVEMPDAVVVKEKIEGSSDDRKVALQVSSIEIN